MKFNRIRKSVARRCLGALGAVCLLAASVPAAAETDNVRLNVVLNNGKTDSFFLAEKPEVTFSGTECVISCKNVDAAYDMADIERAYFSTEETSVIEKPGEGVSIDLTDPATAVVRGLEPGSTVTLYGIDGRTVLQVTADNDGTAVVPLDGLAPKSVYVVSINSTKSFKLYKK